MNKQMRKVVFIIVLTIVMASTLFSGTYAESNQTIPVTGVALSKTSMSLTVGREVTLAVTVVPSNATNKGVTWSSSDSNIATVSNGTVTAVGVGTATITVKTSDGGKAENCTVTVKEASSSVPQTVGVTGVSLDKTSMTLTVDEKETLTATVTPSNATNKGVIWTSSNSNVATVSNGTVTAVGAGTAIIKVTTRDGRKTAQCTVSVEDNSITENSTAQKIHFINIRTSIGDATLLESKGKYALIDVGSKLATDALLKYLKKHNIKELEFVILTHAHYDHMQGFMPMVNSGIKVKKLYMKNYSVFSAAERKAIDKKTHVRWGLYNEVKNCANENKIPIVYVDEKMEGNTIQLNDMTITFYNTKQRIAAKNSSGKFNYATAKFATENYNSIMNLVTVNGHKIFLTGDARKVALNTYLLNKVGKLDVYKVPHHGIIKNETLNVNATYLVVTGKKSKIKGKKNIYKLKKNGRKIRLSDLLFAHDYGLIFDFEGKDVVLEKLK